MEDVHLFSSECTLIDHCSMSTNAIEDCTNTSKSNEKHETTAPASPEKRGCVSSQGCSDDSHLFPFEDPCYDEFRSYDMTPQNSNNFTESIENPNPSVSCASQEVEDDHLFSAENEFIGEFSMYYYRPEDCANVSETNENHEAVASSPSSVEKEEHLPSQGSANNSHLFSFDNTCFDELSTYNIISQSCKHITESVHDSDRSESHASEVVDDLQLLSLGDDLSMCTNATGYCTKLSESKENHETSDSTLDIGGHLPSQGYSDDSHLFSLEDPFNDDFCNYYITSQRGNNITELVENREPLGSCASNDVNDDHLFSQESPFMDDLSMYYYTPGDWNNDHNSQGECDSDRPSHRPDDDHLFSIGRLPMEELREYYITSQSSNDDRQTDGFHPPQNTNYVNNMPIVVGSPHNNDRNPTSVVRQDSHDASRLYETIQQDPQKHTDSLHTEDIDGTQVERKYNRFINDIRTLLGDQSDVNLFERFKLDSKVHFGPKKDKDEEKVIAKLQEELWYHCYSTKPIIFIAPSQSLSSNDRLLCAWGLKTLPSTAFMETRTEMDKFKKTLHEHTQSDEPTDTAVKTSVVALFKCMLGKQSVDHQTKYLSELLTEDSSKRLKDAAMSKVKMHEKESDKLSKGMQTKSALETVEKYSTAPSKAQKEVERVDKFDDREVVTPQLPDVDQQSNFETTISERTDDDSRNSIIIFHIQGQSVSCLGILSKCRELDWVKEARGTQELEQVLKEDHSGLADEIIKAHRYIALETKVPSHTKPVHTSRSGQEKTNTIGGPKIHEKQELVSTRAPTAQDDKPENAMLEGPTFSEVCKYMQCKMKKCDCDPGKKGKFCECVILLVRRTVID